MDAKNFLRSIEREAIVAYTNREGIIEYVNPNFCRISGYSREELLGQDHRIINSGYHSSDFFKNLWQTILAGKVWVGDICNRAKDGSLYWVNSTISPSIVEGEIVGFYAVRNDITKEKELEAKNAELRRLADELQKISKMGGWSYYPNTKKFVMTGQMVQIVGVPESIQLRAKDLNELIPGEKEAFTHFIEEAIHSDKPLVRTFKMISLKGLVTWAKVTASFIEGFHDQEARISGIFQDITDLIQAEEQAERERQKTMHTSKLASIGEMASSVVHEMSNPISNLQANIRMMLRLEDPNEVFDRLEKLEKPLKRLLRLADNLKQYSRGQRTIYSEKSVCDLDEIIKDSLAFLEHRFNFSHVEVATDVESGLRVNCDQAGIEQAFVNLLNNSIDAIEKYRTRWIKIEGRREKDKIILAFIDSGEGIPKNIRRKVFETFYTTKEKDKGTGLGLGIVQDILKRHDATISIDAEDPNTKFVIELPSV